MFGGGAVRHSPRRSKLSTVCSAPTTAKQFGGGALDVHSISEIWLVVPSASHTA